MEILVNPNVAYITCVLALIAILAAIVAPGTGLIEITALLLIGSSAYLVYNIGMNLWALIVLLLSVVPFVIAIRSKNSLPYLIASIIMIIGGSLFLFTGTGLKPLVDPLLVIGVSALARHSSGLQPRKASKPRMPRNFTISMNSWGRSAKHAPPFIRRVPS